MAHDGIECVHYVYWCVIEGVMCGVGRGMDQFRLLDRQRTYTKLWRKRRRQRRRRRREFRKWRRGERQYGLSTTVLSANPRHAPMGPRICSCTHVCACFCTDLWRMRGEERERERECVCVCEWEQEEGRGNTISLLHSC